MDKPEFNPTEIKDAVRRRYSEAIKKPTTSCCGPSAPQGVSQASSCCGPTAVEQKGTFVKIAGYDSDELNRLPTDAVQNSFGCGNPLAFAGVQTGQVVLDIGSGAGIDCFIAAEKVGAAGRVIGLDMTPEMIERARKNAREAGIANVEFRFGEAEKMPVEDLSVDWVISNCVINLSPDKPAVFGEIGRILRPGGRISISDIVAQELPEPVRQSRDAWTGCLAGAIGEEAYVKGLEAAGLRDVRVTTRTVYDASQLKGLFASSCCGVGEAAGQDASALAEAAAGKIWSARFEGVKPYAADVASEIAIDHARPGDLPAIQALLAEAELPTDVEPHLADFLAARHGGRIVGCIGMEAMGSDALFRSLAVAPAYRGAGLGRRMYDALVGHAKAHGVRQVYLLTTTIAPLAEAWGFKRIDRSQVPAAIRQTSQFGGGCCASAVAMWQELRDPAPAAKHCD
ncbi:MAG TPA: arsenic resistance N-acetyltransferase ArsN2 [Candidatus Acidoferrum sp.]|nr:arsenic resistance N-acetyltransferase ArsN2 [Candidatus Acidoferrum sp.]